jgi:hypothetical protein
MNRTRKNCESFEQLILKSQLEKLSTDEISRLTIHMKDCADCRRQQLNFSKLHQTLAVTDADFPAPRPEIRLSLLQRFNELKSAKDKSTYSAMEMMINILKQPIPLYQIAVTIVVIVCIAIFVLKFSGKNTVEPGTSIKGFYAKDNIYEQYINYYPTQSILPQKVGINAAEDTSFNSILFTTL